MSFTLTDIWNKGKKNIQSHSQNFMDQPWATGVTLITCVIIAMLLANLPFTKDAYFGFLHTSLGLSIQSPANPDTGNASVNWVFPKGLSIEGFVNDILMVIFFFTVGLEIRREMVRGELSSRKKAMMPVIAALGGVLLPAAIFSAINQGTMAASGWGIPTATDIAFAVGIMSILGDKVPLSLKVFLTALAIVDDLIAIIVVAVFYGGHINIALLLIAIALILFVIVIKKAGEKHWAFYLIPAIAIWALFYHSGIHATMSGVVMAFIVPMEPAKKGTEGLADILERTLTPWVNFLIMPIFALANAGVQITNPSYFNVFQYSPEIGGVGMGIFLGLVLGKPIGITLASWLAVKTGLGETPANSNWKMMFGVACLGGIGFTMSLLVDTLSFGDAPFQIMSSLRDAGKIAILLASITAGIVGSVFVSFTHKKKIEQ
jgi:NhaA family Na+:H+ antiporter